MAGHINHLVGSTLHGNVILATNGHLFAPYCYARPRYEQRHGGRRRLPDASTRPTRCGSIPITVLVAVNRQL
ncbi:hypothetical protein [Polymorphospora sp. NPDC050346]|uniref:hypothetical protein n=1 Tax=Polymorphospora sp. NPDC050346 TaxID=3155780 RepID=UPI0033E4DC67